MKFKWCWFFLSVLLFWSGSRASGDEFLSRSVVSKIHQCVVGLNFEDSSFGTGFLISPEGHILTAAHVVTKAGASAEVVFRDGQTFSARLISFDPSGRDLALLQINSENKTLPSLDLADELQIGQRIFTSTHALPLHPALIGTGVLGDHRVSHHIVVFDAPILSGSSGGPVMNAQGQVLALVTSRLSERSPGGEHSNFNTGVDVSAIRAFLDERDSPELHKIAHLEHFRMPLPKLEFDSAIQGKLGPENDRLPRGLEYAVAYEAFFENGSTYRIRMESEDFDAYLLVHSDDEEIAAENDDYTSESSDSQLVFSPTASGRYVVVCTSFEAKEVGDYTLFCEKLPTFEQGFLVEGAIEELGKEEEQKYVYEHILEGRDGYVSVEMQSGDVDSFLEIYGGETMLGQNDDASPASRDARVVVQLEKGRSYRVRATTFNEDEKGQFTLRISWPKALPGEAESETANDDDAGGAVELIDDVQSDESDEKGKNRPHRRTQ
ncbi:MAG: serine protease [Verrucomicrobiales bacterium]